jgi:hypothetical protein
VRRPAAIDRKGNAEGIADCNVHGILIQRAVGPGAGFPPGEHNAWIARTAEMLLG